MMSRPLRFFGLTLGCSLPFYALNTSRIPGPMGLPPSSAMIVVPAAVAGLLTFRAEGGAGLHRWLSTLTDLPRARSLPMIAALAAAMLVDGPVTARSLAVFTLAAIPEELGWTSYATNPLQSRFGVTTAGVIIGSVWAAWHVIPWASMGHNRQWIARQCATTVAMRVFMGHLHVASGASLPAAVLFHAASNAAHFSSVEPSVSQTPPARRR